MTTDRKHHEILAAISEGIEAAVKEAEALAAPEITAEDRRMIRELATRDEAGRHFTETHDPNWLDKMERLGIITISRPTNPLTGIPYSQEYWSVGIMPGVPGITDDQGYLIDD